MAYFHYTEDAKLSLDEVEYDDMNYQNWGLGYMYTYQAIYYMYWIW